MGSRPPHGSRPRGACQSANRGLTRSGGRRAGPWKTPQAPPRGVLSVADGERGDSVVSGSSPALRRHLGARFWWDSGGALLSAGLCVVTVLNAEWIELIFGVDPDHGRDRKSTRLN